MVDGWFAQEYLRRKFGGVPTVPTMPMGRSDTGYKQYLETLDMLKPGSSRVHQAVVEEIRRCAEGLAGILNPTQRMLAQVRCMQEIPNKMLSKGFVAYSKRKKSKHKYVPA